MSKKITSICIENCRAYYGKYEEIVLPTGENLLVYGENGSGKSSLYKAINSYFNSSVNTTIKLAENRFSAVDSGKITIAFSDFDNLNNSIVENSSSNYSFSNQGSTHIVPFIEAAALTKGFLDYTDLLKVYFHEGVRPNLYNLIVLNLLGNHIPLSSGGTFKFAEKWMQLKSDLNANAYNRSTNVHKAAINELPIYETHLLATLKDVFRELNKLLEKYFPELEIQLRFHLDSIVFDYANNIKSKWNVKSVLKLSVIKDSLALTDDYNDFLNEARLSALSICLYLASLKLNPSTLELKMLYLDDVFIGLDAGNRLPILNIINSEFKDFQVFISTYDRHWFELSKKYFNLNNEGRWESLELYVGHDHSGNKLITKPLIVKGSSNFEKAVKYLHHRSSPDYPAAANYFRKCLEEMIKELMPPYELIDTENTQLPDYQLTTLLHRTKSFIAKSNNSTEPINEILSLLHNLLHPLSHHEITSHIYKNELIILERACSSLKKQLIEMDIKNTFKCRFESGKRLKLTFTIAQNYFCYYELILKENLIVKKLPDGSVLLVPAALFAEKLYGINNGQPLVAFNPPKNDPLFSYNSLEVATNSIHQFLISKNGAFPISSSYVDMYEFHNGTSWEPLPKLLVWE